MDWKLFKFWLNKLSNILADECPNQELLEIYISMSSYYQEHKLEADEIKDLKYRLDKIEWNSTDDY